MDLRGCYQGRAVTPTEAYVERRVSEDGASASMCPRTRPHNSPGVVISGGQDCLRQDAARIVQWRSATAEELGPSVRGSAARSPQLPCVHGVRRKPSTIDV